MSVRFTTNYFALFAFSASLAGCGYNQPANPGAGVSVQAHMAFASLGAPRRLGSAEIGPFGLPVSRPRPKPVAQVLPAGSGAQGLYVAQEYLGTLNEYDPYQRNAKPFCQTPVGDGNVLDIGVDVRGHLWIPDGRPGEVLAFSTGCASGWPRKVVKKLSDPDGQPAGIAFSSNGTAYVNNIAGPNSSPGSVSIYAPGAKSPTGQLTPPAGAAFVFNVAVDASSNLWVTVGVLGAAAVEEFPDGKAPGTLLSQQTIVEPIGIAFDANQNMLLVDTYWSTLFVFTPPYTGAPTRSLALHDRSDSSYAYVTLNRTNTRMYLDNTRDSSVEVYSYPAGKYLYSITAGLIGPGGPSGEETTGVAINPSAPN
jgi:hypothetical protein